MWQHMGGADNWCLLGACGCDGVWIDWQNILPMIVGPKRKCFWIILTVRDY